MNGYAREERELVERDFEDDVRRAYHARSVDQLQDLRLSFATVAEALRRRAISDGDADPDGCDEGRAQRRARDKRRVGA